MIKIVELLPFDPVLDFRFKCFPNRTIIYSFITQYVNLFIPNVSFIMLQHSLTAILTQNRYLF